MEVSIVKRYGRNVKIKLLDEEGWAVIESLSPDIRVDDLLTGYKIERFRTQNDLAEEMYKTHRIHP